MAFAVDGGIEWEKDGDNKTLTIRAAASPEVGFDPGRMKDYDTIADRPWGDIVEIGWTLVINEGVIYIGNNAFGWCTGFDTGLVLPETLESIGNNAFNTCNITGTLVIPHSVMHLGVAVFSGCIGLTSVLFAGAVTSIPDSAFSGCINLTEIDIPEVITSIGDSAFLGCYRAKTVYFRGSQPTFGTNSMNLDTTGGFGTFDCYSPGNWAESVIPTYSPTTTWTFHALYTWSVSGGIRWALDTDNNKLILEPAPEPETGYAVGQMVDYNRRFFPAPWTSEITLPSGCNLELREGILNIGSDAFFNCDMFSGGLDLPSTVTTIGEAAFFWCPGFAHRLGLPNGLTSIGSEAFRSCTGFSEDLTIPNSVTSIGNYAFELCSGIDGKLTIGSGVTSIGVQAFRSCYTVTEVEFKGSQPTLSEGCMEIDTRSGSTQVYKCKSPNNWAATALTTEISGGTIWEFPSIKGICKKVSGTWKNGRIFKKKSGVWVSGTAYIKKNGEWK